jgi:hypothetical protein
MSNKAQQKPPGAAPQPLDKPAPRHVADEPAGEVTPEDPIRQNPVTDTGLVVEEQVRKEWDPKKNGGLPTSLRVGRR